MGLGSSARVVPPRGAGAGRPQVSLCMVVRDEEANLPACLRSVRDLVDEVVVVDTGSADRTKDVAAALGARVVDFPWCDDFAAARNEGLGHATRDWVFWLDADEHLDDANRQCLGMLLAGLKTDNLAYVMKQRSATGAPGSPAALVDHVRLFRRHPDIRWQYRVHEQILPAIHRTGGGLRWADVVIEHAGYRDETVRRLKAERNLRLLQRAVAEHGDDPYLLLNLAPAYQELVRYRLEEVIARSPRDLWPRTILSNLLLQGGQDWGGAERALRDVLALDPGQAETWRSLARVLRQQGRVGEAAEACREGQSCCGGDASLLLLQGLLCRELGDAAGAEDCLVRLLGMPSEAASPAELARQRRATARHNLALIYRQGQRQGHAEAELRAAIQDDPSYGPAWLELAELLLEQGRGPEVEDVADHVEDRLGAGVEAAVLRARVQLARQDFAAARQTLQGAITRFPQALPPRLLLSDVSLREGTDWAGAEKALRNVLALAPGHAEARHNLALVLEKRRRRTDLDYTSGPMRGSAQEKR